jgi:peptidoglycan/xylan/chitin deacetylase (PgdA/CDA1 family)/glycosyltransferase involved in cell wall biosynthesis
VTETKTAERLTYSAVIPTKDRHGFAVAAIERLLRQTRLPAQIVVVDASTPGLEVPRDVFERARERGVELLVRHHPPSTSAQRNFGVELVTAPIVLFLDDDIELPPDYAEIILERWERGGLNSLGGITGSPLFLELEHGRLAKLLRKLLMLHYYDDGGEATTVRRSGKMKYVFAPSREVSIPAVATGAVAYRTELARRHRFDERFTGYVLGEDLDMAMRVAAEGPIIQLPEPRFVHHALPGDRESLPRWSSRGRSETYFRLRHLRRDPLSLAAFGISIVGEAAAALVSSIQARDAQPVRSFAGGFLETLREVRAERMAIRSLRLHPRPYYHVTRALQGARVRGGRGHVRPAAWTGVRLLGYHRVTEADDVLAISPDQFRRQLETVLERGLKPIRLDRALELLQEPISERYVSVTFDDGYRDNLENALPILEDLGVPATVFIVSGTVDGRSGFHWYGRRGSPPALTWEDVAHLLRSGLVDVQAHSRSHPALPRLDETAVWDEIAGSKRDIERHVEYELTSFCYPAGRYGPRELRLVEQSGFRAGVTTTPGVNPGGAPLLELRRTMMYWRDTPEDFNAKLDGLLDTSDALQGWLRSRRGGSRRLPLRRRS